MRPAYQRQGQEPDQTIARRLSAGESDNVGAMLPAGTHTATYWRELLELHGAAALAHYTGRDAGQVAITTHRYGAGMA